MFLVAQQLYLSSCFFVFNFFLCVGISHHVHIRTYKSANELTNQTDQTKININAKSAAQHLYGPVVVFPCACFSQHEDSSKVQVHMFTHKFAWTPNIAQLLRTDPKFFVKYTYGVSDFASPPTSILASSAAPSRCWQSHQATRCKKQSINSSILTCLSVAFKTLRATRILFNFFHLFKKSLLFNDSIYWHFETCSVMARISWTLDRDVCAS